MGLRIGIDLGTTNSVAAFTPNGLNPEVVISRENERLVPSIVALRPRDGTFLVGQAAKRFSKGNAGNTIFSIKRLMGRRFSDKEVARIMEHVPYRIVSYDKSDADLACVMLGDKVYTPIEISAMILEKIKTDAESRLGEKVTHAVITVPAYFDDNQKEATRQAGYLAGLKVSRIIDEPSAAAYAFGLTLDPREEKAIVVYDLGGGTFDVSVMFISNGIPAVEIYAGDNWLGGDKFDQMIMDYVLANANVSQEMRQDENFRLSMKELAEAAKWELGQANSADIVMYDANLDVVVPLAEFESGILPDLRESVRLVSTALEGVGMSPEDIDHVLLVGGSTALPLARRLLAETFGEEKIKATVNPMECVALGAAILASRIEKKFCINNHENEPDAEVCSDPECGKDIRDVEPLVKCPHCQGLHRKQDVKCEKFGKPLVGGERIPTAKPYGIGIEGDRFSVVVPKGTLYPTQSPCFETYKTVSDYQEWIIFPVYQGFEEVASKNEVQGKIVIGPIPQEKRAPKGTPVEVRFSINEDGILTVEVYGQGDLSGITFSQVLRRAWENGPGGGDDETVPRTASCPHCGEANPRGAVACSRCGEELQPKGRGDERPEWERDLVLKVALARVAVQEYEWAIHSPENLKLLRDLVERGDRAVERKDEANGRTVLQELSNALDTICTGLFDLLYPALACRYQMGRLDQNQRLSNMLSEYKRRVVVNGEKPHDGEAGKLRYEQIPNLYKEIMEGLDDKEKVNCQKCGELRNRPSPLTPACEKCGYVPDGLTI